MDKFRKLKIWQKAMDFITHVYLVTNQYPQSERYSLIDQIRRAAISIILNIAEGSGAGSDKEFARFLQIAFRSIYEVITGLEIAIRLKYGKNDDNEKLIREADEIAAMMNGFLKKLKADS